MVVPCCFHTHGPDERISSPISLYGIQNLEIGTPALGFGLNWELKEIGTFSGAVVILKAR